MKGWNWNLIPNSQLPSQPSKRPEIWNQNMSPPSLLKREMHLASYRVRTVIVMVIIITNNDNDNDSEARGLQWQMPNPKWRNKETASFSITIISTISTNLEFLSPKSPSAYTGYILLANSEVCNNNNKSSSYHCPWLTTIKQQCYIYYSSAVTFFLSSAFPLFHCMYFIISLSVNLEMWGSKTSSDWLPCKCWGLGSLGLLLKRK
jgi:hypothetical protein